MKAIRFHQYGDASVLQYDEIPVPQPGPGEVLVRVHAAGINPIDWKIRQGYLKGFRDYPLPFILGWDVSGVVESQGQVFKPGDEVWGKPDLSRSGSYAEYMLVQEADLAHKPKSIDHVTAAAVPLAGLTAWQALFDHGGAKPGNRVLVHAGAGGVGTFAIQFAKAQGLWVAATASGRNQDFLRDLGTDLPVNYETTKFEEVVSNVDVVVETMGGDIRARSWKTLRKGGTLVAVIGPPPSDEEAAAYGVYQKLMWVASNRAELDHIGSLITSGKVKPIIHSVFPLSATKMAHELSATNHARGKIVLKVV